MDEGNIRFLAKVLSLQAEMLAIEVEAQGYIAENKAREIRGESPAYTEESFIHKSKDLSASAYVLRSM